MIEYYRSYHLEIQMKWMMTGSLLFVVMHYCNLLITQAFTPSHTMYRN